MYGCRQSINPRTSYIKPGPIQSGVHFKSPTHSAGRRSIKRRLSANITKHRAGTSLHPTPTVSVAGYGHISPSTTTGRAITIVYAIFGIPMFLILLADFGKLFTRGIKFLWAFVRRVYYTGSCRKVRRTVPVQVTPHPTQIKNTHHTFLYPNCIINTVWL